MSVSTSPPHHLDGAPSLLTIPAEVRLRIYKALFSGITLSPGWKDLGPGSRQTLIQSARYPSAGLVDLLALDPAASSDVRNYAPERPRRPVNLAVLVACRKIHDEAYPALLRLAVFSLATIEDHVRLAQPRFLPLLGRIHKISVGSSILGEWSSTLVRLVLPSISHFEVRDIQSLIPHSNMLSVDSRLPDHGALLQDDASTKSRYLLLLQQLLINTPEASVLAAIVSHFTAAPDIYKCLVLHFKPGCFWGNMPPHEHPSNNCVFAFGEPHVLLDGASLTTLPPTQWSETGFILRQGFSLGDETWIPGFPLEGESVVVT